MLYYYGHFGASFNQNNSNPNACEKPFFYGSGIAPGPRRTKSYCVETHKQKENLYFKVGRTKKEILGSKSLILGPILDFEN